MNIEVQAAQRPREWVGEVSAQAGQGGSPWAAGEDKNYWQSQTKIGRCWQTISAGRYGAEAFLHWKDGGGGDVEIF